MKKILLLLVCLLAHLAEGQKDPYTLVLHGGAGNGLTPKNLGAEKRALYRKAMTRALEQGAAVLDTGGKAADAVVACLTVLENSPLFNAGRGSVLTWEGQASMDASLMVGRHQRAGAVAGLSRIKNPIRAAQAVRRHSRHVLLSGPGADRFAIEKGLTQVDSSYLVLPRRLKQLESYKKRYGAIESRPAVHPGKMGTVGCAVRDRQGRLAAGTSTGGMMGKRHGRIGDSPLIGAGTYAHDSTVAVSCTGHGEYFIRYAIAHNLHSRMRHLKETGAEAAQHLIHETLRPGAGDGGLIGVSHTGEIIMEFNTKGMLRGYLREGAPAQTAIFEGESLE